MVLRAAWLWKFIEENPKEKEKSILGFNIEYLEFAFKAIKHTQ